MIPYLLKFTAILLILFSFYAFFLESENIHQLKRFYLLLSIVAALIIPLITFTQYIEPENFTTFINSPISQKAIQTPFENTAVGSPKKLNYILIILSIIYGLGVLLFGIRFVKNIRGIYLKIKQCTIVKTEKYLHVLVPNFVIPHTFLNYIFLNRQKFEAQLIPNEVLLHEQAHAQQKHTLDILFIEVLQIVFWFHPLCYFIKKSIKLNHEFLADKAVLKNGINPIRYQQILLTFSSSLPTHQLSNAINYAPLKKRFTLMKTQTSKNAIWLRSLLLLPLLAVLIYGFSNRDIVQKENNNKDTIQNKKSDITISLEEVNNVNTDYLNTEKARYYQDVTFEFTDKNNKSVTTKTFSELSKPEKQRLWVPKVPKKKSPSQKLLRNWANAKIYGIWIDDKRIKNSQLRKYSPTDFDLFYVSPLAKNAKNYGKHYFQVDLYSKNKYRELYQNGIQPLSKGTILFLSGEKLSRTEDIIIHIDANGKMLLNDKPVKQKDLENSLQLINATLSFEQRKKKVFAKIYVEPSTPMGLVIDTKMALRNYGVHNIHISYVAVPTRQQKATPKQLAEYNTLAKKYNAQPKERRIVKLKDFNRLEYLYRLLSPAQKERVEPFPEFPPPPPVSLAPAAPSTPTVPTVENADVVQPPAPKDTPESEEPHTKNPKKVSSQKTGSLLIQGKTYYYNTKKGIVTYYDNYGNEVDKNGKFITPEPPLPPISPLDHIIEMAKKGAVFYFENKKITSDRAIELLKKNDKINISTTQSGSKKPIVSLSVKPIKR